MATGTEGNDTLSNDRYGFGESIYGLGGDDTIDVKPNFGSGFRLTPMGVFVDGGSGFDTLTVTAALILELNQPGMRITNGSLRQGTQTNLGFAGIERLVVTGTAYFDSSSGTWSTAGTIDEINLLGTVNRADILVSTGGGDDQVRVGDVGSGSVIRGGDGNDLIDLSGVKLASVSAFGEGGDDILIGSDQADSLDGGSGNDSVTGGAGNDLLKMDQGGKDVAQGGRGDDVFYFGATMNSTDTVDGGPTNDDIFLQGLEPETDRLYLQGNYVGATAVTLTGVANVEQLILLSADDASFGGHGPGPFSYDITTENRNAQPSGFDPFAVFVIDGRSLRPGENLTVNGSAESDATLLLRAGQGVDSLTGGNRADFFEFGDNFTMEDRVNGGVAVGPDPDFLILRGNYSGSRALVLGAGATLQGIEALLLISGHATSFRYHAYNEMSFAADAGDLHYAVTTTDGLVPAGGTFIVSAGTLLETETLVFDGSAERDGRFSIGGGAGADRISAGAMDDRVDGAGGNDLLLMHEGGTDTAGGGAGNDVLYFGKAFDPADRADGGAGRDAVVLQGNYALTLGEDSLVGIESISLQSGATTKFGDMANNFYDFSVATADGNVAAGEQLIVNGQSLRAGEDLTFDGSAETDGRFLVYAGHGSNRLTGGDGADIFYFDGGRWGADDRVDGRGGIDQLTLSGSHAVNFGAAQLIDVENLTLVSQPPGGFSNFDLTMNDANVAAGRQLTVDGAGLGPAETLVFKGTAETDGTFLVLGGKGHDILFGGQGDDTLLGGQGDDVIAGGVGRDLLLGDVGNDVFRYDLTADSTPAAQDTIRDFSLGDLIDLSRIDADSLTAGDQAFSFIGAAAFGNRPGELRIHNQRDPIWLVQGDTNGDGIADFELILVIVDRDPVTSGDFIL